MFFDDLLSKFSFVSSIGRAGATVTGTGRQVIISDGATMVRGLFISQTVPIKLVWPRAAQLGIIFFKRKNSYAAPP